MIGPRSTAFVAPQWTGGGGCPLRGWEVRTICFGATFLSLIASPSKRLLYRYFLRNLKDAVLPQLGYRSIGQAQPIAQTGFGGLAQHRRPDGRHRRALRNPHR